MARSKLAVQIRLTAQKKATALAQRFL